jgi:hypothetical protein
MWGQPPRLSVERSLTTFRPHGKLSNYPKLRLLLRNRLASFRNYRIYCEAEKL